MQVRAKYAARLKKREKNDFLLLDVITVMEGNKFYLPWTFEWKWICERFFQLYWAAHTLSALDWHGLFDHCVPTCVKTSQTLVDMLSALFELQRNICILLSCAANSQSVAFNHKWDFSGATDKALLYAGSSCLTVWWVCSVMRENCWRVEP